MLWKGFKAVPCIDCERKSNLKNCYGEEMCYECHSRLEEENEQGISRERND